MTSIDSAFKIILLESNQNIKIISNDLLIK